MRDGRAEALQVCLKLSRFPPCHSERGEEISDHFFDRTAGQKPEVFRFAQHDSKRGAPILAFFPED